MQNKPLLTQSKALDYCKQLTGKRPAPSTYQRWYRRGVSGVKLRTMIIAGVRYTDPAWMDEFFEQSAAAKSNRQSQLVTAGVRKAKAQREAELALT